MPTIAQLVEQLGSSDPAQSFQAQRALLHVTAEAGKPGNEVGRAETAAALAQELHATVETKNDKGEVSRTIKHAPRVRDFLCRYLADVGSDPEVPALKQALDDLDLREMARWALTRIRTVSSTEVLADVVEHSVGPEFRIGVVNALAGRRETEVSSALGTPATDQHLEVRLAAAEALATLGDASLDEGLVTLLGACQGDVRAQNRIYRARIRLAESLAGSGEKDAARQIYQAVLDAQTAAEPQHRAAQLGLKSLS